MKITAIKSFPVRIGTRNQMLVKVETDQGLHGWGESGMTSRERAVAGAVEHYAQFLMGRDPMRPGALWQEMYRSQYFEGGRVLTAAISAIDIALYDIMGKALGVPVYQLLGGKQRDFVPTFATIRANDRARIIELTKQVIEAGWDCVRLPRMDPNPDNPALFDPWRAIPTTADWMIKVREAVGSRVVLGIDWHHRLSVAETASFCQRMPMGTLDFVEEPIRDESPEAYASLRTMTDIPFAIGEEFSSKWQFLPYIERGLTQFSRVDICNVGGFTEAMKVAGWCEAHYIDLMPHNPLGPVCAAATIHLAAAVPNFCWMETRESPGETMLVGDDVLFINRPKLVGSRFPVPDTPGLGIDIDDAVLQKSEIDTFIEFPHLRRSDGSHTNW